MSRYRRMSPFIIGDFVKLRVDISANTDMWGKHSPYFNSIFIVIMVRGELLEVSETPILELWLERAWSWKRFMRVPDEG